MEYQLSGTLSSRPNSKERLTGFDCLLLERPYDLSNFSDVDRTVGNQKSQFKQFDM